MRHDTGKLTSPLVDFLLRRDLNRADGRPLHAYAATDAEQAAMRDWLAVRHRLDDAHLRIAQAFVLWAAEHIRMSWRGGPLSWDLVFGGLDRPADQQLAMRLVADGLECWGRPLRRTDGGRNAYLYSLLAEGGLPDALVEDGRYGTALLATIADIEAEGSLGAAAALDVARPRIRSLPQVYRNEDSVALMAELACALVTLREQLPSELKSSEAALAWLDRQRLGWRSKLPLRLSDRALETLICPALTCERGGSLSGRRLPGRKLRRLADGSGWGAFVEIPDGARLPSALLPADAKDKRLRLVMEHGAALLAVPDDEGWTLRRAAGPGPLRLRLPPHAPLVVAAHSDGRLLAEPVLDAGLPAPDESPGLWREDGADSETLVPLGGSGRTRAARVWLLAPADAQPAPRGSVSVGVPEPAPGGLLWPVEGTGTLTVAVTDVSVATGADYEEETATLIPFGRCLPGWSAQDGSIAFLGTPDFLGAVGDCALRNVAGSVRLRPLGRLGGQIAQWSERGIPLARLRLTVLPPTLAIRLKETGAGSIRLEADGLSAGWHAALLAGGREQRAIVPPDGALSLQLTIPTTPPGFVRLRLSRPGDGAALTLEAPWPATTPLLVTPDGTRQERDRDLLLEALAGWRGWLPDRGGGVQLGLDGERIAFSAAGAIRLSAYEPVAGQALALAGPDGRVNLRLVCGAETCRLRLGRYDWQGQIADGVFDPGLLPVELTAIFVDDPREVRRVTAEGPLDLAGWLGGGSGVWFLQGRCALRGAMRMLAFSAEPQPLSTRSARVAAYRTHWERLLGAPEDPEWGRLWRLLLAVREAGSAAGLDQMVALGEVPAAAVALLLRARAREVAAALALDTEAPLCWPLVPCAAWADAMRHALAWQTARFRALDLEPQEAEAEAARALRLRAGQIIALEPALSVHLGQAMHAAGLPALAENEAGEFRPLVVPDPQAALDRHARALAARAPEVPQGVAGVAADRLGIGVALAPYLDAVRDAPLVAAEVAAGLRSAPDAGETLRLIALRHADPAWFDCALPAALTFALSESPS